MRLHVLPSGPLETNAYLVCAPERGEAVLIDAPEDVREAVAERLQRDGCRLVGLFLTHAHYDHIMDAAAYQREGVPVYAHPADRPLLEQPEIQEAIIPWDIKIPAVRIDRELAQGQRLDLLGLDWELRHVPGHCPGNVLFHLPAQRAAFVGDVIFAGSVGRTDFPGCSFEDLERSIRTQVYTLPGETRLYPGHGPVTTVEAERRGNPFVRP